ncbi:BGTF surface domain-containing protein [Haloprofundus sp. MHR1]|uniref:BGTF surface domain-containing protein n=1 Tax=Haloprofundus sp. MHR1 TaxID=2572921 RepID=UPI0010BECAE9|nr:BGTF surface domain-containing protein [Haloprofundus sp. MHR1]QCJ47723.1 PGF-CTERM sorting domain-containing protein [Haloprofundus sp. MHR1]
MTQTTQKFRAVFLAALMVFSVFAGTVAFAGTAAAANAADADSDLNSGSLFYQGQELYVDSGESTEVDYQIRTVDDGSLGATVYSFTTDADGSAIIDTSSLGTGSYVLVEANNRGTPLVVTTGDVGSSGEISAASFDVTEQDISASFEDESINQGGETTLNVDSAVRSQFDLVVEAEDLSNSEISALFEGNEVESPSEDDFQVTTNDDDEVVLQNFNKGDEYTVDFTDVDAGQYNFTFSVADTTAQDSTSIEVDELDQTFSLPNSVNVESGDTTTFQVEMQDSTEADLLIGSPEDGYSVNATVVDEDEDGVANVTINTYEATQANNYGLSGDEDSSVTAFNNDTNLGVSGRLDSANYDIEVGPVGFAEDSSLDSSDISTLAVTESSIQGAQSWTAPAGAVDSETTREDVLEAIEDGEITQDSTVAAGDLAIVQIQGSGFFGAFERGATEDVSLEVEEMDPGANREPGTLELTTDNVVVDDENNNLFVVVDTESAELTRPNDETVGFSSGNEYNVTMTASGEVVNGDDDVTVGSTFEVVDREASLETNDDDVVEVAASENGSVEGESSIAPGSEIRVRAQSESGATNTFVETQTVTVGQNGTFNASFDFADLEAGTNFTLSLNDQTGSGLEGDTEYSAVIVNGTSGGDDGNVTTTETNNTTTETTTDEPTETTEDTPEETTEETTEGGNTDGETETDTPGFGVIVALVALIAAALLAVRRDN